VLACLAENGIDEPALGVVWDGTGFGTDGTIWGGEFLTVDGGAFSRFAHLRTFPLPGGDAAAREPRRALAGLLWEIGEIERVQPMFQEREFRLLVQMLERGVNTALTSSAGRLIDAVAALLGVRAVSNFEAQAAMDLEFLAGSAEAALGEFEPVALSGAQDRSPSLIVDWEPEIRRLLRSVEAGGDRGGLAAGFHGWLVAATVEVARAAGREVVALSGGCFQNRLLLEGSVRGLRSAGFRPHWHQRVPANDGGISLGQVAAVLRDRGRGNS
jgi:hydrogenase maturation protein HypF